MSIRQQVELVRKASWELSASTAAQRTALLVAMAEELTKAQTEILAANESDCTRAHGKISSAMLDRLRLTPERFAAMVAGVREIAEEPDVLNECMETWQRSNGLTFEKRRVPLGVVAIIYESRPNVTADAAAICIRSGNAVILRGGSEALETNRSIAAALRSAAVRLGINENVVSFVDSSDRAQVNELLQLDQYIDVVIPRGGEGLIRAVSEQSRIPVLKHYKGVCHLYVDASADSTQAIAVCRNAKVQRPGVCNAVETLLVHQECATHFLQELSEAMPEVSLRGCEKTRAILDSIAAASEEDWSTEYLDLTLSVKVVDGVAAAIEHINTYGSKHTDGILSADETAIASFLQGVDSGVLTVNASTRFNDGSQFGKGAEIGISTDKLHARGPVGARELTTYKYIVRGNGTIRD